MQLFFKTRSAARVFASKNPETMKAVDNRSTTDVEPTDKNRWGVSIQRKQQGFTMIELLIVLVIALIVISLFASFFGIGK